MARSRKFRQIKRYPEGKRPSSHDGRFYIERKYSMTSYPLSMLYGAAILAPVKYGREVAPVYVRLGLSLYRLPISLVKLTRVFNKYIPGTWAHMPTEKTKD